MSIAVAADTSGHLMEALRALIDTGGAGSVALCAGERPASGNAPGTLVVTCVLATPCGAVNFAGDLVLYTSAEGQILSASTPTWARITNGSGAWVLDCDARLSNDADLGQEIVVSVLDGDIYPGAFVRIASGLFSARP